MMGSNASVANEFAEGGLLPSCYTYPAVAMTPYDRSIQDNRDYQDLYKQPTHPI